MKEKPLKSSIKEYFMKDSTLIAIFVLGLLGYQYYGVTGALVGGLIGYFIGEEYL